MASRKPLRLLDVRSAAQRLGVTERWVRMMCHDGELACEKFGNSWVVTEEELQRFRRVRRPPGRPSATRRSTSRTS